MRYRLLCPVKGTHNTPEIRIALKVHPFLRFFLSKKSFFRLSLIFTLLTLKSIFSSFHVIFTLLIIFSDEIYFTVKTSSMIMKGKWYPEWYLSIKITIRRCENIFFFPAGSKAVSSLCRCFCSGLIGAIRFKRDRETLESERRSGCPLHAPAVPQAQD